MDDKTISYYAHEDQMNRLEVHNKRWFIFSLILFIALILTNGAWLVYECSFEDTVTTTQTVTQDSDGGNNSFNGDFYGGK